MFILQVIQFLTEFQHLEIRYDYYSLIYILLIDLIFVADNFVLMEVTRLHEDTFYSDVVHFLLFSGRIWSSSL
jgi:hypothetical protein